jgi:membrane-bound serine protease (ClpP class)
MNSPLKISLFSTIFSFLLVSGLHAENGPVIALSVTGIIDPVVSDYVIHGIKTAEEKKASAVLIELDTPGGLLDATRELNTAVLNTSLPVIVYVTPRGARATSAGLFISMAADVVVMSPETHIGAAHPVNVDGKTEKDTPGSVMEEKMVSDAAAYIRSLAIAHGRNVAWAEQAVRESVSLTAEEAVRQNVVDTLASSRDELLKFIDGRPFKKNTVDKKISVAHAPVEEIPMSPLRALLHTISHPNVAYILMTIGLYGLIYELATPGLGLGGIGGGICLLLAFFSLHVLPISTAGVALIVLGVVFIAAELFTPTHGALAVGGVISFTIGSMMLIDPPPGISVPRISLSLVLPSAIVTILFFVFVARHVVVVRRARPRVGRESLIGTSGVVKESGEPESLVFLNGELWRARSTESLAVGDLVVVTAVDGIVLAVTKSVSH